MDLAADSTVARQAGDIYLRLNPQRIIRLRNVLNLPDNANTISLTDLVASGIFAFLTQDSLTASNARSRRSICSIQLTNGSFPVAPLVIFARRYRCATHFVRRAPVVYELSVSVLELCHFRTGHMTMVIFLPSDETWPFVCPTIVSKAALCRLRSR